MSQSGEDKPTQDQAQESQEPPRKNGRRVLIWLGVLVLVSALALAGLWGGRRWLLAYQTDPQGAKVIVTLPKGAGLGQAARILAKAKVVDHPDLLVLAAYLSRRGTGVRAGEYQLNPAMSYGAILETLRRGRVLLHSLLIPEGFSLEQIARRLEARGLASGEKILALARDRSFAHSLGVKANSLEGYLFPATYRLPRGLGEKKILTRMVNRFLAEWRRLTSGGQPQKMSRPQIVTLASIIEREAQKSGERPLIAAVYHNRLKKGMRLQADPTVIYGLKNFDGNLTKKDLELDTSYNTYLHPGLPPGPICSPGAAALAAALNPAKSSALYFVAKGDGSHHFSSTYRDHSRAVWRYQKNGRRKK